MAKDRTIFNQSMMSAITDTTKKIATEALGKMCCMLTREEYLEAFFQPDHIGDLTSVYRLIGGQNANSLNVLLWTADNGEPGERLVAQLRYMKQPEILVPGYITTDFRYFTPAGAKVMQWAQERKEQGLMVADAIDAMEWLNTYAGSAMGFSVMFPALTPIMSRANPDKTVSDDDHWVVRKGRQVDALKNLTEPLPQLPQEVIDRIREVSSFIMALMMTKDAELHIPRDTCAMLVGVPAEALRHAQLDIYKRPHVTYGDVQYVRSFV